MYKSAQLIAHDVLVKVAQPPSLREQYVKQQQTGGGYPSWMPEFLPYLMGLNPVTQFRTRVLGERPAVVMPHQVSHKGRRGGVFTRKKTPDPAAPARPKQTGPGQYRLPETVITARPPGKRGGGQAGRSGGIVNLNAPQFAEQRKGYSSAQIAKWNKQWEAKQQRKKGVTPVTPTTASTPASQVAENQTSPKPAQSGQQTIQPRRETQVSGGPPKQIASTPGKLIRFTPHITKSPGGTPMITRRHATPLPQGGAVEGMKRTPVRPRMQIAGTQGATETPRFAQRPLRGTPKTGAATTNMLANVKPVQPANVKQITPKAPSSPKSPNLEPPKMTAAPKGPGLLSGPKSLTPGGI